MFASCGFNTILLYSFINQREPIMRQTYEEVEQDIADEVRIIQDEAEVERQREDARFQPTEDTILQPTTSEAI